MRGLENARAALERHGDHANAAHAGYLLARRFLLIGRLDEAQALLEAMEVSALPPASRAGAWLVMAGIAMRRIEAAPARTALAKARLAAERVFRQAVVVPLCSHSQSVKIPLACFDGCFLAHKFDPSCGPAPLASS